VTGERATVPPRWHITRVRETGSTNADLLAMARAGAPFGSVLVADHQTAGRGRLGRRWEAPEGSSLLVSILLPPDLGAQSPAEPLQRLTHAVALAAAEACEEVAGVRPELKWPNDLLVGDRKLAGILAETVVDGGRVSAVVVGLGLNVSWPDVVPAELAGLLTALNHEAGRPVDRQAVLDALLAHLADTSWDDLAARYRERLGTLGRRVRVDLGTVELEGVAVAVADDGSLVVEADGGSHHVVTAGDVVHLRAVP
jgi:BirA family biotin operon repressor/biotin-[acetyl-CoA-carboxylase] ligase